MRAVARRALLTLSRADTHCARLAVEVRYYSLLRYDTHILTFPTHPLTSISDEYLIFYDLFSDLSHLHILCILCI